MHLLVLFIWFAACAAQDLYQRQISNLLTLGGSALALLYLMFNGHSWLGSSAVEAGWALLIVLVLTLPGYALKKLGAGDVKLLIALALATDRLMVLGTFIGAGLSAAVWVLIASKITPVFNQRLSVHSLGNTGELSKKLPFAPFLLCGFTLTVLLLT